LPLLLPTITCELLLRCALLLQPVRLSDFKAPGADLTGIHYLRNVADADALLAAVEAAKAAGNKVCLQGALAVTMRQFAVLAAARADVKLRQVRMCL
jgi:monodehydroascorbate reductase (NADH)